MISRVRIAPVGGLLLLLGALFLLWRPSSSAVLYSGYARAQTGYLSVEVIVDPPVALPGDTLRLTARVINEGTQSLTPSVALQLPRGISADVYALPAGATSNIQENRIDWLPIVPAGGVVDFTLAVVVQTADVLVPEQSVSALLRHQGAERTAEAPLWIGIPPLISELLPRSQVAVGQPIQLQAEVAGPGPLKTVWDLGDGRRLDLSDPVVTFPSAGQYAISLEVSNPGATVTRRAFLTVLPDPVASFRPDDDAAAVGQPVTFVNTSGGQPPLTVFWDFGDGTTLMGEQQPSHTYRQGGNYRARLTVENKYGRSEAVWDVTVGQPPIADLVVSDRAVVGQPLVGQAFTDDTVTRFLWDMGDGRRREGVTISHLYRRPGDYYVTLLADNGYGQTQVGRWVHVDPGTTSLFLPLTTWQSNEVFTGLSADAPPAADLDPVIDALSTTFALAPIPFAAGSSPAEQLYAYVNAARGQFSLPPLAYGYELSAAAQSHARDKASFPDSPHTGSDGTTAAERLLRAGYRRGYAGEATAWVFADPRLAVEFWMNSDTHRPLLLNRLATDLGVGYVEDFGTANVWHWTAEFGVGYDAPARPVLRVQSPEPGYGALDTEVVNYSWLWPLPLGQGQRFTVYVMSNGRAVSVGSVSAPVYGSRYILSADARGLLGTAAADNRDWFVRLEDGLGQSLAESERRVIALSADANTPVVQATATLATATPIGPTVTPSPTLWPTAEVPTLEPPPLIITATPQPEPTDEPTSEPPPPVIVTATPQPTTAP